MPELRAYLKTQYSRLFGDEDDQEMEVEPVASTSSSFSVTDADRSLSEEQVMDRQFDLELLNRTVRPTGGQNSRFTLDDEISNLAQSGNINPRLKHLKDALSSVPATSVDAERAFSTISRYLTKFRNRLSDSTLDALSFSKHYMKRAAK